MRLEIDVTERIKHHEKLKDKFTFEQRESLIHNISVESLLNSIAESLIELNATSMAQLLKAQGEIRRHAEQLEWCAYRSQQKP